MLQLPKFVLYDTVFQGMEGNHTDASMIIQQVCHVAKRLLQHLQLPVDFDPDRLKGPFGRVSSCRSCFCRYCRFYNMN